MAGHSWERHDGEGARPASASSTSSSSGSENFVCRRIELLFALLEFVTGAGGPSTSWSVFKAVPLDNAGGSRVSAEKRGKALILS